MKINVLDVNLSINDADNNMIFLFTFSLFPTSIQAEAQPKLGCWEYHQSNHVPLVPSPRIVRYLTDCVGAR